MPLLPSANSVVDFLRNRGLKSTVGEQLPLYDTRKRLYETLGLDQNLGEYRGSETQNPALLYALQQAEKNMGTPITAENVYDLAKVAKSGTVLTPPPQTAETQPTEESPTLSQNALEYLYGRTPSPEELGSQALQEVTSGATFPLRQEAAGAEKAALQLKGEQAKETLLTKLASRGLIFSGKKQVGLEAIDADTVANILGVDRRFALLIASGMESAAQRIVKEAQRGNQQAHETLRALGYEIIGGQLYPTLAAKSAAATQARAEATAAATQQRFVAGQAATQQRFETTQQRLLSRETSEERTWKEDMSASLADLAKAKTREDALNMIDRFQTSIMTSLGQTGLDIMKKEVDRLFPPPPQIPATPQETRNIFQAATDFIFNLFR